MALGGATLQAANDPFSIGTVNYGIDVPILDSAGNPISSLNGYIATFWFAQSGDPGDLVAVGAAITYDYAYDYYSMDGSEYIGGFDYNSTPAGVTMLTDGTIALWSIRVFQIEQGLLDSNYDGNFSSQLSLTTGEITAMWADAENGLMGEWGDFQYHMTPIGGAPVGIGLTDFADLMPVDGYRLNPIPEPSTWLLLGAGTAFMVIMRRRKKQ